MKMEWAAALTHAMQSQWREPSHECSVGGTLGLGAAQALAEAAEGLAVRRHVMSDLLSATISLPS